MKIRCKYMTAFIAMVMMCCFFVVSTAKGEDLHAKAPMFTACIEYSSQGYIVKGSFTEFPPDIRSAEVLYSLDGETYQTSGEEWNITKWSDGPWTDWDEDALVKFQNQTCLHANTEPLKSYLAGTLNCFYVKLRLTRENGMTYDTQAAVIDRGKPSPVPEEITPIAGFAPSICIRSFRPFSYYGRYEITVSEDSTSEEISAFLPDTLPIKIDLQKGISHVADGIVDCPVIWKPLADLALTPGESVTITDAAEKIVIPEGMVLNTPLGDFQMNESLEINQHGMNDEVRLILNVIEKGGSPTGVLSCDFNGLDMAFHQKPTGARSIRTYTLAEGETEWTELLNLPLLEAVNAQPSTAGSGYTYVLDNTHKLYQSYMDACAEGRAPAPFFIGMKIEGGVYDGQELILSWPDTYDLPLELPKLVGSGGNEANAGADHKGDATEEGQRPSLPQDNEGNGDGQLTEQQNTDAKNKRNSRMAGGYDTAQQSLTTGQAPADTIAKESSPAPVPSENAETDAQTKSPTPAPRSAPGRESDSTAPSVKGETSLPNPGDRSPRLLPAAFIFIITILCIAGLSIAAASRKRAGNTAADRAEH